MGEAVMIPIAIWNAAVIVCAVYTLAGCLAMMTGYLHFGKRK